MSKKTENPNENCLRGMRCPDCASYGAFTIRTKVYMRVADEGTDDPDCSDMEWEDNDWAKCEKCGKIATWGYFREEMKTYTVVGLYDYPKLKGKDKSFIFIEKALNPQEAVAQCRARNVLNINVIQVFEGHQHGLLG